MWVGVPGLREIACDCCIVGSFIGETDRSLLQGSNHTHRYKVHFEQGSFVILRVQADACIPCFFCVYTFCVLRQVIRAGWWWESVGNVVRIQERRKDRGPGRRSIDKGNTGRETERKRQKHDRTNTSGDLRSFFFYPTNNSHIHTRLYTRAKEKNSCE